MLYVLFYSPLVGNGSDANILDGDDSNRGGFDDEEDDDGDGLVWPTLTLSPRFDAMPPVVMYGPFFEPEYPTNISVLAGQTVLLQCRVMDLGDRVVSVVFCK